MNDWIYRGDISLREGGFFWRQTTPGADHVEAVDVFAYPEEDNLFGVVKDIIFMPEDRYRTALETCGYELLPGGNIVDCTGEIYINTLPILVEAFYAYWGLDDTSFVYKVQMGGPKTPDRYNKYLPHHASLRKFVTNEFL